MTLNPTTPSIHPSPNSPGTTPQTNASPSAPPREHPPPRIAHTAFTLAGPFASLAVATPAATLLTVGALSGRLTLTADIAVAVATMDESASVAVGGVFLLAGGGKWRQRHALHRDAASRRRALCGQRRELEPCHDHRLYKPRTPAESLPCRDRSYPIDCLIEPFFHFV